MDSCIFCGKLGMRCCGDCLKKIKKGTLSFLFPLTSHQIAVVTNECKPKEVKQEIDRTTKNDKKDSRKIFVVHVEDELKPVVEKEKDSDGQKSPSTVKSAPDKEINSIVAAKETREKYTDEEIIRIIENSYSPTADSITESIIREEQSSFNQSKIGNTTISNRSNNHNRVSPYNPNRSCKLIISAITIIALLGLIIATFFVPWNIGQWFVGILFSLGILLITTYLLPRKKWCLLTTLFILTVFNICLSFFQTNNISTISAIFSISMCLTPLLPYVKKDSYNGWLLILCSAINLVFMCWKYDLLEYIVEKIFQ